MTTVNDVLHHIAQDFESARVGIGSRKLLLSDKLVVAPAPQFQMSISITTDIEATELHYQERLGQGRTFYFKVSSYQQGKDLAAELYKVYHGYMPDMSPYTGQLFTAGEQLYLFLHIRLLSESPKAAC